MVCAQAISQGCVQQVTLRDELMSASRTNSRLFTASYRMMGSPHSVFLSCGAYS